MQKYNPNKSYNFLNMVPPWSNYHIRTNEEIHSSDALRTLLKNSASFPQTFDTFHDYDGLTDVLQRTANGEGIKLLGKAYNFMNGESIGLHFKGSFSFDNAIQLDVEQIQNAIEDWLNWQKAPESIMGLSTTFKINTKSLCVFKVFSNGYYRIVYSFTANIQIKSPILIPKIEDFNKIVTFWSRKSQRSPKLDRIRWKFLCTLATYGNLLQTESQYEATYRGEINYALYRPTINYKENLIEYQIERLYRDSRYKRSWSYLSIVPLAIIAGYGKEFKPLWEKYGPKDVISFNLLEGWELSYKETSMSVKFSFWLREGPLKNVLESLHSAKNFLTTQCGVQHFYKSYIFSDKGWKTKKPLKISLCISDEAEVSFESQCKILKDQVISFLNAYEKFLKKLYKNEPNVKITCSNIVRKIAPAYCERIRKEPQLFLNSPIDIVADYAKDLIKKSF